MSARILIVDDERDLTEILGMRLEASGFSVEIASDGETALEAIRKRKPDLVLLDILMPGMDGYQVCRALRRDPATAALPVIFLSAMAAQADRDKGLESGGTDYVTKPFDPVELIVKIRSYVPA